MGLGKFWGLFIWGFYGWKWVWKWCFGENLRTCTIRKWQMRRFKAVFRRFERLSCDLCVLYWEGLRKWLKTDYFGWWWFVVVLVVVRGVLMVVGCFSAERGRIQIWKLGKVYMWHEEKDDYPPHHFLLNVLKINSLSSIYSTSRISSVIIFQCYQKWNNVNRC